MLGIECGRAKVRRRCQGLAGERTRHCHTTKQCSCRSVALGCAWFCRAADCLTRLPSCLQANQAAGGAGGATQATLAGARGEGQPGGAPWHGASLRAVAAGGVAVGAVPAFLANQKGTLRLTQYALVFRHLRQGWPLFAVLVHHIAMPCVVLHPCLPRRCRRVWRSRSAPPPWVTRMRPPPLPVRLRHPCGPAAGLGSAAAPHKPGWPPLALRSCRLHGSLAACVSCIHGSASLICKSGVANPPWAAYRPPALPSCDPAICKHH